MRLDARQRGADLEKELSSAQQFTACLIDSSPECIKVLDLQGQLLSMNQGGMKAREICDLGPVLNSQWANSWQGEDRRKVVEVVATARNGGIGHFIGFFATTQTTTPKWWDVVVSPFLVANGKSEKLLGSSRRVTRWKRSAPLLHAIIEGTAAVTGKEFFRSLVRHFEEGIEVLWGFVAECLPNLLARWRTGTPATSPRTLDIT